MTGRRVEFNSILDQRVWFVEIVNSIRDGRSSSGAGARAVSSRAFQTSFELKPAHRACWYLAGWWGLQRSLLTGSSILELKNIQRYVCVALLDCEICSMELVSAQTGVPPFGKYRDMTGILCKS